MTKMYPDKIELPRHIYDNVHGFIGITDLESKVIDSPFFQRLRRIRQLSLVDYVFPGALHNRFNHSLGVMHIADKMVVQLQEDGYLEGDRKLIRMAGLLHDVGHYPLSHVVEKVVQNHAKLNIKPISQSIQIESDEDTQKEDILADEERVKDIWDNQVHLLNDEYHQNRNIKLDYAHHERMASIVIKCSPLYEILTSEGSFTDKDIKTMCQIIAGSHVDNSKNPASLIIHSELDADRFDYLLRDSGQTGVIYGLFDMDQIIRNLKYIEDDLEEDSGKLAVGHKAIKAVEHYLMSRYFFYNTVISHKASIGFEIMAKKVYEALIERGLFYSYFDLVDLFDNPETVDSYLDYDDAYFFNTLRNINKGLVKLPDIDKPKYPNNFVLSLINNILNRIPLKLAFEDKMFIEQHSLNHSPPEFMGERFQKSLKKYAEDLEDYWYIPFDSTFSPTNLSPFVNIDDVEDKTASKTETIRILYKEDNNGKPKLGLLVKDPASIISVLGKYELKLYRVYTKDEKYKEIMNGIYNP